MALTNEQRLEGLERQKNSLNRGIEQSEAELAPLDAKLDQGIELTPAETSRYFQLEDDLRQQNQRLTTTYSAIRDTKTAIDAEGADSDAFPDRPSGAPPVQQGATVSGVSDDDLAEFGSSPPPAPVSDPQAETTQNTDNTASTDGLDVYSEDFTQTNVPTPEYGGGRGTVVEQPGERAEAVSLEAAAASGGGRGTVIEQPGERELYRESQQEQAPDPYDEFGDIQRDVNQPPVPEPEEPQEDPVVNEFDEFASVERDLSVQPNVEPTVAPEEDVVFGGGRGNVVEEQGARAAAQAEQQAQQRAQQEEQDRVDQARNAALERLRTQSAAQQNREPEGKGDWRVKLRLASGANYFYNQQEPGAGGLQSSAGIMAPLIATDGIVFPYTPSIQILYAAEYNQYQPTHSNYKQYFYKGSNVGEVILTAQFSAQDTEEANYLLAVIHFLKSASKMFYGQDAQRGSPPPLLFLTGLGDYQFNEAPCVISQFNYVLPNEVDYIRANVEQIRAGTLQTNLRNRNSGGGLVRTSASSTRIRTSGLSEGAENTTSRISSRTANLSSDSATYVPTKMEMTITMLPVQNRLQASQEFSLKEYANGDLIKGGFW